MHMCEFSLLGSAPLKFGSWMKEKNRDFWLKFFFGNIGGVTRILGTAGSWSSQMTANTIIYATSHQPGMWVPYSFQATPMSGKNLGVPPFPPPPAFCILRLVLPGVNPGVPNFVHHRFRTCGIHIRHQFCRVPHRFWCARFCPPTGLLFCPPPDLVPLGKNPPGPIGQRLP